MTPDHSRLTLSSLHHFSRRPRLFQASEFQSLAKYLKKFGSASFRGKLIDILPLGELKELKRVVMKMHTESINILTEKRAALEAGDDAMVRAMGEGKDIMSILRQ